MLTYASFGGATEKRITIADSKEMQKIKAVKDLEPFNDKVVAYESTIWTIAFFKKDHW